ncbi:hypothetical protein VQ042_23015 [Aurantimonas sp. A2-1-M11]|uniref:hypothetical protein n=1 Tax=Aurantimonas sp. A2-1-M11 TaxID=3113712 RepID=UPI002F95D51A
MTELASMHSKEGTKEYVAWLLIERIAREETSIRRNGPDRKYLLDLYVESLQATGGHRPV